MPREQLRIRLSNAAYGWIMRVLFNPRLSPRAMRRNLEAFAATPRSRLQRLHPAARFRRLSIDGLPAESIVATPHPQRALLYLHGGGYVFGSVATYRRRALRLSYRCRAEVILPDYRLAPEHPFPAALDDAQAAWQWLSSTTSARGPLFVAGDSAGGGLALSLMVRLRDAGARLPDGAVLLSPWTDLMLTGDSIDANAGRDCWLRRAQIAAWAAMYAAGHAQHEPLISPLNANLRGLPPLLLLAGDREILLDDTLRLAERARAVGVPVDVLIGAGMQHDWPLTLPWLEESRRAWRTVERFVDSTEPARRTAPPQSVVAVPGRVPSATIRAPSREVNSRNSSVSRPVTGPG